jgi:hypothetical protein
MEEIVRSLPRVRRRSEGDLPTRALRVGAAGHVRQTAQMSTLSGNIAGSSVAKIPDIQGLSRVPMFTGRAILPASRRWRGASSVRWAEASGNGGLRRCFRLRVVRLERVEFETAVHADKGQKHDVSLCAPNRPKGTLPPWRISPSSVGASGFRMLLGREVIRKRFLVDSSRSYLFRELVPKRKKKRRP